jgi:hypothetical protein
MARANSTARQKAASLKHCACRANACVRAIAVAGAAPASGDGRGAACSLGCRANRRRWLPLLLRLLRLLFLRLLPWR